MNASHSPSVPRGQPPSVADLPLSVVIIAKNEAGRIRDCLESVAWAPEIIVVDDFSEDETASIAREFTPKIHLRRMDIEGRHRNYAYGLASREWVLSLDADERVTPELKDEIVSLLKNNPDCNGYTVPRRNFVGNTWVRYGGMYPSAQLKLFRRDKFKYDESAEVHPQAYMSDPRGVLKNDLLHFTYRDFTDAIAKLDRQTDLEARKWFREGRKIGLFLALWKTVDRFVRMYVAKKGYRDGVIGLFLAVNAGMYQFLSYVKFWELKRAQGPANPPEVDPPSVEKRRRAGPAGPPEAPPSRRHAP